MQRPDERPPGRERAVTEAPERVPAARDAAQYRRPEAFVFG